jgi:hypothetical protein
LYEATQNFVGSLFKYSKLKFKNQKSMGLMTFLSLSNDTTLLQIQSGGTVPLNEEDNIHILSDKARQLS